MKIYYIACFNYLLTNKKQNMKFLKLIFFTTLISLTFSCSSDDDNQPANNGNIVGVWKGTAVDYSGTTTTTAQGQSVTATYVGEAYDIDYTLTFTDNPKKVVSAGNYSIELTTTVYGQTTTQNIEGLEFLSSGDWSINGNILTITVDNQTDDTTIVELTNSTLVLKGVHTESTNQGGVTSNSTTETTLKFRRL